MVGPVVVGAAGVALARGVIVVLGLVQMLGSDREYEWSRSMRIALPEPFLLLAVAIWALWQGPAGSATPSVFLASSVAVVATTLGGIGFAWALSTNQGVGTGHYIEDDQRIVVSGPYALVRHPLYSSAIFVWLGLALATGSWPLATLVFGYVIPAYFFYASDEEAMMTREFGADYDRYRRTVPMLFPRPLAIWD